MRLSRRTIFTATVVLVAGCLTLYGAANPGVAACALIEAIPTATGDSKVSSLLTAGARRRIQDAFGTPLARPIIVFWDYPDLLAKLHLNEYASAHFLGTRSCIFIGPEGRSIDVVAHELMHAETFERIGPWARMTQLPTWFDEGLAMQVDYRERYTLRKNADTTFIRNASNPAQFFVANDQYLTRNYAAAKIQVAQWVAIIGGSSVYERLARIRSGEPFVSVVAAR